MSFVHGIFGAYRQYVTKGRLAARYASLARPSVRPYRDAKPPHHPSPLRFVAANHV